VRNDGRTDLIEAAVNPWLQGSEIDHGVAKRAIVPQPLSTKAETVSTTKGGDEILMAPPSEIGRKSERMGAPATIILPPKEAACPAALSLRHLVSRPDYLSLVSFFAGVRLKESKKRSASFDSTWALVPTRTNRYICTPVPRRR